MRPSDSISRARPLAAALALLALCGTPARGGALVAVEDALARAFPAPVTCARKTAFLTAEQAERIARESGTPLPSKIVAYYLAIAPDGQVAGYAYVDTHLVRTLQETVLVMLGPDLRVRRVEVLAFHEPREYLPSARWLGQFEGRAAGADLTLGRGIRAVAGATLSSRAMTDAVRRVLATHRVIHGEPAS